nr:alkaline phosphatase D family protein [Nakamurella flavida]
MLIGPVLRHVGTHDATVWVEVDGPCEVEILGHRARTWTMAGHHYALVTITGLAAGSDHPYQVRLDDDLVWPRPDDPRPACRIRTLGGGDDVRVVFGSCRFSTEDAVRGQKFADDALDCYARDLVHTPQDRWPDALLMLGDQVYADDTSAATKQRIAARRDPTVGAKEEVADFEEYTWLYDESWTDPDVRWLFSVLPTSMIFDDHDVHDDWNTSHAWRRDMQGTSWWQERVIGALSSYWVYQHLGNLSPAELAADDLYQRVLTHDGDVEPLLRVFAAAADREADGAKGYRWSYRRDLGRVRLLVVDSRCGRILADDRRTMVSDPEFDWIIEQVAGDYDHLLLGTSLPWLLPRAMHDVEAWNEVLGAGRRGRVVAAVSEKLRRAADLEHWASFGESFARLSGLIRSVAAGEHAPGGVAPATVCVLSGDVHHAYVATAHYPEPVDSAVYQLTCSPLHNHVPPVMKMLFRGAWSRAAERCTRVVLGLLATVPVPPLSWTRDAGPFFGDEIAVLALSGRRAELRLAKASSPGERSTLHEVEHLTLS